MGPPTTGFVLTWARNVRSRKEEAGLAWMIARRKSPDDTELVFLQWCHLSQPELVGVMQELSKEVLADDDG